MVITRATRSCAAAGGSTESQWEGNLCLPRNEQTDGFSIVFDGVSGPLVRTSTSSTAHPEVSGAVFWSYETQMASDLRIRRVEKAGSRGQSDSNGDWWVTWWEVTAGDGTLYVFGREFLFEPVSSADASDPATTRDRVADSVGAGLSSLQTAPAYVPGAGCSDDLCDVGVAWHLDQVLDTSGNLAYYRYGTEFNYYEPKKNGSSLPNRQYESFVGRWYIDYGMSFGDAVLEPGQGTPPFRVVYESDPRTDGSGNYPDAPTDLDCGVSDNCADGPPAFYSKFRLKEISTRYMHPSSGVLTEARKFVFNHQFLDPPGESGLPAGEQSGKKLWLTSIDPTDTPPVTYSATWMDNRVNHPAGVSAMQMPRIGSVTNESGGDVDFTYAQSHPPASSGSCSTSNTSNIRRDCDMYVAWDGYTGNGGWVWWHKWKVTQTTADAAQGGSEPIVVDYDYSAPEWAYAGQTGMGVHHSSQCRYGYGCNVWNDFRGHRKVTATDADGAEVEHHFFTGMANDRANPTGNTGWLKDDTSAQNHGLAWVTSLATGSSIENSFELAGRPLGTVSYNASGQRIAQTDATYTTAKVTDNNSTADRFIDYPISYRMVNVRDIDRIPTTPGSTSTDRNELVTHLDTKGRVHRLTDLGNSGTADDRTTFYLYAQNTTNWIVSTPMLIATRAGNQTSAGWGNWLSASSMQYDGGAYGTAPIFGRVTIANTQARQAANGDPVWSTTSYAHNSKGQPTTTVALGDSGTADDQTTVTGYDSTYGYVSSVNGPLGSQDDYSYVVDPAHGQPTTVTDPNSGTTTLTYDSVGRLTTVTPPGYSTPTAKYTYTVTASGADKVKTETLRDAGAGSDAYVQSWDYYDGFGRSIMTQSRHRDSNTVSIVSTRRYDDVGRLLTETDPMTRGVTPGTFFNTNWGGNPWAVYRVYSYPTNIGSDPDHDAGCTTGSNGKVDHYRFNNTIWESTISTQCGLVARAWDMAGNRTETTTDVRGNTTAVVNAAGDTTSYDYNLRDQLVTVTDPVGNEVEYAYDDWETQATSLDDPDLGTISYAYDLHGRLDTQTDARGVALEVQWDKANRPTLMRRNGLWVSKWDYDPTGAAGQLHIEQHWNRDLNGVKQGWVMKTHTYNTRQQVDSTSWQIENSGLPVESIDYTYRDSGAVDTITYPNNTVIDYRYNRLEQPDRVTADGAYAAAWVGYDNFGRATTVNRGTSGTANKLNTTRGYNTDTGRLTTQVTTDNNGDKVQDFTYTHTDHGLISAIRDESDLGGGVDQTACYTYDVLGQLLKGWTRTDHNCANGHTDQLGPQPLWSKYTYNSIGNITNAIGNRTVGGNYTYPTAGNPRPHAPTAAGSHSYTYDAAGNRATHTTGGQTETYVYDVQNRLISIGGAGQAAGSTFLYDAEGERVKRTTSGNPDVYYYNNYEVDSNGNTTVHIQIAGETVGALVGTTLWTTAADHLGSASYSASTTGSDVQRYTPYGGYRGPNTNTQPTDRSYTNQTNDNTGLYYYGARYHDPILGQFTQPDTIVPIVLNPTDWNRYAYVRNNPLRYTDPSGHCPGSCPVPTGGINSLARAEFGATIGGPSHEQPVNWWGGRPYTPKEYDHWSTPLFEGLAIALLGLVAAPVETGFDAVACASGAGLNPATAFNCGSVVLPVLNSKMDDVAGVIIKNGDDAPTSALDDALRALCSFDGSTRVLMADGSSKPIEDVEVGDWVLAEDPETAERGPRQVTHLWVHQDTIIDLEIDGHDVATTEDHPFWNATDSEWQRADALDAGDLVVTADGNRLPVGGVDFGSARIDSAFNLGVDDLMTYFVASGDDFVLVHNQSTCPVDGAWMSVDDALDAGQRFVGSGADELAPGVFRSATPNPDGSYNVFRMTADDLSTNHAAAPHVNFEIHVPNGRGGFDITQNSHVFLSDFP